MSEGILNNPQCRSLYEEINKRELCIPCRLARKEFEKKDQKNTGNYSNMIPGFSSPNLRLPLDLLIVAEAHGGGRIDSFRGQQDLSTELKLLEEYYLEKPLSRYHQSEMKKLLLLLKRTEVSWIFTDLIKCFVWQKNDEDLKGKRNVEIAKSYCGQYLTKQIDFLNPTVILSLGQRVSSFFDIRNPKHAELHTWNRRQILHSLFPSRNTADRWIQHNGWKQIIKVLRLKLPNRGL
jgi:hypothetical protein